MLRVIYYRMVMCICAVVVRHECVHARRAGLYLSAAKPLYDAREAAGHTVTEREEDCLGDTLAHRANHSTAHK